MRSAFGDWEDRDPAAATQYLANMPQSPQRDSAISGFSSGYAWQDPEVAIAWAQDIGDPALRQQSLTRAGQIINAATFKPMIVYSVVAACYFVICFSLSQLSLRLEKRLHVAR